MPGRIAGLPDGCEHCLIQQFSGLIVFRRVREYQDFRTPLPDFGDEASHQNFREPTVRPAVPFGDQFFPVGG